MEVPTYACYTRGLWAMKVSKFILDILLIKFWDQYNLQLNIPSLHLYLNGSIFSSLRMRVCFAHISLNWLQIIFIFTRLDLVTSHTENCSIIAICGLLRFWPYFKLSNNSTKALTMNKTANKHRVWQPC